MCGLAGFVDGRRRLGAEDSDRVLAEMTDALAHRGPDDRGFWTCRETGVHLGHRRLSIVDVSPLGHQPMVSPSGRYVIAYNGEIYNHHVLRKELEDDGAVFRGHSDTEVLLASVEHRGLLYTLDRCVGMFAFALWDHQTRSLTLGRDRMGEKPLYYGYSGTAFLFASELKAMRRHPAWEGEVDRDVVPLYLRYNYVPAPWSIYRGIYKLPAGCILTLPQEAVESGRAISATIRTIKPCCARRSTSTRRGNSTRR